MTSPASSLCPICGAYHGGTNYELECRDQEIARLRASNAALGETLRYTTEKVRRLEIENADQSLKLRGVPRVA